mmetsp:Transcript_11631/g.36951  ORF Transcript_11631/g.36951 Transcript_11631/m.36951 type:complete len:353 (-) Transcript_11631:216-1274(-)
MTTRQKDTMQPSTATRRFDKGTLPEIMSAKWQRGAMSPKPVWPTAPKSETSSATLLTFIVAKTQAATRTNRCKTQAGTRLRASPDLAGELPPPGASRCLALRTQWPRICEAGSSCRGKVTTTASVTKRLAISSNTNPALVEARPAKKAIKDAVSSSPRKATPQGKVTPRKMAERNAEASSTTFGKASGSLISLSTGRTSPSPSKEKKTLAASMMQSTTGRWGQAAAARAGTPTSARRPIAMVMLETTATIIAKFPSLLSPPSCETSRSRAAPQRTGTNASMICPRLIQVRTSSKFPTIKSTKQTQTPPCTTKTKASATLRPQVPRANCATSPRSWTLRRASRRLHSVSTSMV